MRIGCMVAIFFLLPFIDVYSQKASITFKGKLIRNGLPVKRERVVFVNYGTAVTDDNGEFDKSGLPENVFEYELQFDHDLVLTYPSEGRVSLPKDPNKRVLVYIGEPKEKILYDNITSELSKITKSFKTDTATINHLIREFSVKEAKKYDLLLQKSQLEYAILLEQAKIKSEGGRRETLSRTASIIDHFISRALDLKDELASNGSRVFNNEKMVYQLSSKIDNYSQAYEQLNKNREKIIKEVEDYWQDEHRTNDIRQLLAYALDDFHKTTMLRANLVRDNIDAFNNDIRKKKRKRIDIENDIKGVVFDIQTKAGTLESQKARVVQVLKDAKYRVNLTGQE